MESRGFQTGLKLMAEDFNPLNSNKELRKPGNNPELIEHRLNELDKTTDEIKKEVNYIKITVVEIRTGMITKNQLLYIALSFVGVMVVAGLQFFYTLWKQ